MTKQEIIKMVEPNIRNNPNPMIDYDLADGRISTEKEDYEAERL